MTLPESVATALGERLGSVVRSAGGVGGGCVSPAWRVALEDGRSVFVKTAPPGAPPGLLDGEALSLRRLAETGAVRVPEVLAVQDTTPGAGPAWLALEWLQPGAGGDGAWARLGAGLAALHRHRSGRYGWERDNCIGPLPQRNEWTDAWPEFWAEQRLRPQLDGIRDRLPGSLVAGLERLLERLADRVAVAAEDGASLLHGDLWSGNVHMMHDGAALVDPSCSFGHREVDLAMAELFGGFPSAFHEAYEAEWPLLPGAAARRPVYQLYYLLVHVRLFGSSYVSGTERALHAALRA